MLNTQTKLKKSAGLFFLVVFLASGLGFGAHKASAVPISQTYVVQLKSADQENSLQYVGTNIEHEFVFSSAYTFQNIYSFSSLESLADLQSILSGKYIYLEQSASVAAEDLNLNDPGYTQNPQDTDKEWGMAKAGFSQVWEKSTGAKTNIVAVIDTGIDATHEDLSNINFVPGYNFLTNQPIVGNLNSDDNGHGTLVAGILGASPNNGLGIVGTNWQISLMPLKTLDSTGKGDVSLIAQAIVWAADHGAGFINLSVGGVGFGHDVTLANAISYAFGKGVVIVAAAGNDVATAGSNLDNDPVYPICDDNNSNMVIGVAASDQNDLKPAFSNYGGNCVDVTAPGKRILSTISFDPITKKSSPNSYAFASGTSMAVPFVVGQAAIIKSLYPNATNVEIRDRIISTADPIDSLNPVQCGGNSCAGLLGSGRINVVKSIQPIAAPAFSENDLVRGTNVSATYQIIGGQKRLVSQFVLLQRFAATPIKTITDAQLAALPDGPYVTPLDGTLVKSASSPAVYQISQGQKLPITYQIFLQRKLSFAQVNTLSDVEVDSWISGNFLAPTEATLVKVPPSKTLYWVVGGVMHPINKAFYDDKGLKIFPIITISKQDFTHYSQGESYVR